MGRFFRLSPGDCRTGAVQLAHYTGWSLAEIGAMTCEDMIQWFEAIPKPDTKA